MVPPLLPGAKQEHPCRNTASTEQSASPVTYRQTRLITRVETKGCQLCKAHPPETKLILMRSSGGDGANQSDMQDRHTEVWSTSELLVTLCLSSASHHRRFQRASQCAKRRVSSINDEFTERLSVVKVNLHKISYQLPRCNQNSMRVKCHLLLFRHHFGFPLIESGLYVLQVPVSLNLDFPQALIFNEAGSGWTFTRENQQTVAFVTPCLP